MNSIIISGRLTGDPEMKIYGDINVCKFSVAVNRAKDKTDFFNCSAFGKTAKTINEFFKKGAAIIIRGEMQSDRPEKITYWSLVVREFSFVESKKSTHPDSHPDSAVPAFENIPF